jgi:hypothetical protein
LPWRRIYTTNYDDTVEFVHPNLKTFNYDEPVPRRIADGSIIHLHGVIRSANTGNVSKQLVLGELSYVRQHLEKSPWLVELDRDVRFADNTFFIGYSLRDQHIAALLLKNPATKDKIFFLTRGIPDHPTRTRFEQYGRIWPVALSAFINTLRSLPKPLQPATPNQLKSLRYLDPLQDKAAVTPPTAPEVRNLLAFGIFNFKRMIASLGNEDYVVNRNRLVGRAVKSLGTSRTLIIDSRLGNGKTIFLYVLGATLSTAGYTCFFCRNDATSVTRDLDALRRTSKVAIFFDSYNTALDLVPEFGVVSQAVFVVAVRNSVRAVQMHEILSRFPGPLDVLSIDSLQKQERDAFSRLANKAGLLSSTFDRKVEVARDLRELVLTVFDNAQIRSSIQKELLPGLTDARVRKIFLASYALKQSGYDADPAFLREVTGVDPYESLYGIVNAAAEIFDLEDELQIRSAVFCSYLIDTFFEPKELLTAIEQLIVNAISRRAQLRYRRMAGALMQVSFLSRTLYKLPNYQQEVRSLFERFRLNSEINAEPLFWLQYAILMTDDDKATAENFIATAYARARDRGGFLTYQIDTFALRLALLAEIESQIREITRFDDIVDKLDLVIRMLRDASHRYHAINVLNEFEPFVAARSNRLTIGQKVRLVFDLSRAISALQDLRITGLNQVRT